MTARNALDVPTTLTKDDVDSHVKAVTYLAVASVGCTGPRGEALAQLLDLANAFPVLRFELAHQAHEGLDSEVDDFVVRLRLVGDQRIDGLDHVAGRMRSGTLGQVGVEDLHASPSLVVDTGSVGDRSGADGSAETSAPDHPGAVR